MQDKLKKTAEKKETYLSAGFHLEADKMGSLISVCVANVTSVSDFTSDYAILISNKKRVKIYGYALSIAMYENKTVEIFGRIGGIEFL